ncbi:hypothetical protein JOF56_009273 [Kibdelosporangium banguiense]|uniref:Bacterial Ig domain-containing protein n=1 Tax=Kibdelosporangium banguiense TaxID=1365924 RepID=A0ABS4TWZ2_9PSEU|nr:hypothetical protein [Kibdelosporangium banguiense]MBP2328888.1 hypothetical protein [Kibdelosporangium banguiense]
MYGNFIAGTVGADGTPEMGEGFDSVFEKDKPGIVTVTFRPEWTFAEPPAVVATQVYPDKQESAITPNTLSNVAVRWVTTRGFQIATGAPNGLPLARKFSFIAAGILGTPKN